MGVGCLNDRTDAMLCRDAGPRRRTGCAVGDVARRAVDGIGVLQRLAPPAVSGQEPEECVGAHAPPPSKAPVLFGEPTPLSHLHHISIFHLVAQGRCTFETARGQRREIGPGDILLMPFADAHEFWAGDATETAYVPDLVQPGPIEGMLTLNYGGGGEATTLVVGHF